MTYLWEKIRVQGGAYGGFGVFDSNSGVFSFLSYRDPNLDATLENYDNAAGYLKNLDAKSLSDSELTKAIIAAIGDMDSYQLPDAKGYTSMMRHLTGRTDEIRFKRNVMKSSPPTVKTLLPSVKFWRKPQNLKQSQ